MSLKDIIEKVNNSSDIYEAICDLVPNEDFLYTSDLINQIDLAKTKGDSSLLETILSIASRDGLNGIYTKVLCNLLNESWHHSQEDIAMMLEEIKDPESVNCLYTASLIIPWHDDGRSLAKKCIWALKAINTPEALNALKLLAKSKDPIISEVALQQLG